MNLREDMIKLSGGEVITEGVKYFKFSKRIDKVIYKTAKSTKPGKEKLLEFLNKAKEEFKEAESVYASGNEIEGKKLYKEAKMRNSVAIKKVLSKETKSFVLRAGLFGGIAGLLFFLTKGTIDLKNSGKFDEIFFNIDTTSKDIVNELNYVGRAKDAAYFDSKYSEVGRRAGHATKEQMIKAGESIRTAVENSTKTLPKAAEDVYDSVSKTIKNNEDKVDGVAKKVGKTVRTFSGYVSGLTDAERGGRSR